MKVYLVVQMVNESNPDDCLGFIRIFSTYEKANEFFKTCVANEYSAYSMYPKDVE
jgi:hypothetical protein